MKFKITYYRTLVYEGEIEANTLDEAKQEAENRVADMSNMDFDQVDEEVVEIDHGAPVPVTVVTFRS